MFQPGPNYQSFGSPTVGEGVAEGWAGIAAADAERKCFARRGRFVFGLLLSVGGVLVALVGIGLRSPSRTVRNVGSTSHLSAQVAWSLRKQYDSDISYSSAALADEVTSLPGLNSEDINFRHFAGYIAITESKNAFYWYMEAENDAASAPLVWWSNGGPGCSGLYGLFTEMGPFRPHSDGSTIEVDSFAWNTVANMLFVEMPAGVGYSYTTNATEMSIGDFQTAQDNYLLIQGFLERFPHLRDNDFYLTAESYGGHYIPTLAKEIIVRIQNADSDSNINLKGFAVGNPYTDPVENIIGTFDTMWGHQLISEKVYLAWKTECAYSQDPATYYTDECTKLEDQMWMMIGDLDPYALDYPVCEDDDGQSTKKKSKRIGRDQRHRLVSHMVSGLRPTSARKAGWSHRIFKGYEACESDYSTTYLNRKDVKEAIHASSDITWSACSDTLDYQWDDESMYMEPYYSYFMDEYKKLRILVYSGDDDSVCATRGTQLWIENMGWDAQSDWSSWTVDGQVAGYIKKYQGNFTFATVHGAGHEVPTYRPTAALHLFTNFINNSL